MQMLPNLRHLALATISTTLLASCALMEDSSNIPFAPAPEPREGLSLVYIYRFDGPYCGNAPLVSVDGKPVFHLRCAEYSAVYLKPGKHQLAMEGLKEPFDFETAERGRYYTTLTVIPTHQNTIGIPSPAGLLNIPLGPAPNRGLSPYTWHSRQAMDGVPIPYTLEKRWYRRSLTAEYLAPSDPAR